MLKQFYKFILILLIPSLLFQLGKLQKIVMKISESKDVSSQKINLKSLIINILGISVIVIIPLISILTVLDGQINTYNDKKDNVLGPVRYAMFDPRNAYDSYDLPKRNNNRR